MYVLLAIAILCMFALLLAALARLVRTRRISAGQPADFADHLFAAAKDQDARKPRTLPQQNVMDIIAKTSRNRALEPTLAETQNQSISSKRL